jgi:hypothetical protein
MHKQIHLQTRSITACSTEDIFLIDVMARWDTNIDSDQILVVIKLRARICRANNLKPLQLRRFAVDRLKDRDVASRYYDDLESELHGVQAQPLSLDEKCKKLEEIIQRVATDTISYTRKQANKKWLAEKFARVNEEKNAARERAIQIKTRGAKNASKLARTTEKRFFQKKARQLDEEVESSKLSNIGVFRTLVNFTSARMTRVLARWKVLFEENLNEGSESEQPTRLVNQVNKQQTNFLHCAKS